MGVLYLNLFFIAFLTTFFPTHGKKSREIRSDGFKVLRNSFDEDYLKIELDEFLAKHRAEPSNTRVCLHSRGKSFEPLIKKGFETLGIPLHIVGSAPKSKAAFNSKAEQKCHLDIVKNIGLHGHHVRLRTALGLHTLVYETDQLHLKGYYGFRYDGLAGRGILPCQSPKSNARRLLLASNITYPRRHTQLNVYNKETGILLIGQFFGDTSQYPIRKVFGSVETALHEAVRRIKYITRLPVYYKAHPLEVSGKKKYYVPSGAVDATKFTLHDVKSKVVVAVSFNSQYALDIFLEGIPVLALDPGSFMWPIVPHSIEDLHVLKDKSNHMNIWSELMPTEAVFEDWLAKLVYTYWSAEEIISGKMLKYFMWGDCEL